MDRHGYEHRKEQAGRNLMVVLMLKGEKLLKRAKNAQKAIYKIYFIEDFRILYPSIKVLLYKTFEIGQYNKNNTHHSMQNLTENLAMYKWNNINITDLIYLYISNFFNFLGFWGYILGDEIDYSQFSYKGNID